jgi:hypothetical protein
MRVIHFKEKEVTGGEVDIRVSSKDPVMYLEKKSSLLEIEGRGMSGSCSPAGRLEIRISSFSRRTVFSDGEAWRSW